MKNEAQASGQPKVVAIACGGTGGHLFPGLAVGKELQRRGCEVTLLISPKEVDQQAAKIQERMREMIKKLSLADKTSIPSDYDHVVDLAFEIKPGALSGHV